MIEKIAWFTIWFILLLLALSKYSTRKDGLWYPKYYLNTLLVMFFLIISCIVNKN